MTKRRRFSGDLKAKTVMEGLRGDWTLQEIASKHQVHPNQVSTWNRQAMEGVTLPPSSTENPSLHTGLVLGGKVSPV